VTNSPPANVNLSGGLAPGESGRVLASGIDSLTLAVELQWADDQAFRRLAELKEEAKKQVEDEPITVAVGEGTAAARFVVKPHGSNGYEWLLVGKEMAIKLGSWLEAKQRPSAMVDLRAELLWTHGPDAAVERVRQVLGAMGAKVERMKPSRLDLCVDVLLPGATWTAQLDQHFVTRARGTDTHRKNGDLSGFSIGKGAASARIYDKAREIREKSHKDWMFDVWKLPAVPEGHRVVRVEFQLRRDMLREGKLQTWEDVRERLPRAWAYCCRRWLRLVVNPKVHHTQQEPLPWWLLVEEGFAGAQQAEPLIREKAINTDRRRLAAQSIGTLSSIAALDLIDEQRTEETTLDRTSFLRSALAKAQAHASIDDEEFTRRVDRKRAKYGRAGPRFRGGKATADDAEVESAAVPEKHRS